MTTNKSLETLIVEHLPQRGHSDGAKQGATGFPARRLRRLRQNDRFRRLIRENALSIDDLILPMFVVPGHGIKHEINSMPGNYHLSIDKLIEEAKEVRDLGIPGLLLFGVPAASEKDLHASKAYSPDGIVQEAVRALKRQVPEVLVVTDVCLCEFTPHCHCGILDENGYLLNDESKEVLAKTALSHVQAGSDMVAPAAMLDGQISAIREALDGDGFVNTPIMGYSAKYASKLYDPFFKEGTQSALSHGDKKTHQMDSGNSDEAMREIALDIKDRIPNAPGHVQRKRRVRDDRCRSPHRPAGQEIDHDGSPHLNEACWSGHHHHLFCEGRRKGTQVGTCRLSPGLCRLNP
jgi:porphobilinogen synthase